MNSKERVRACIRREPTDAVPLGFYLVDHDIIATIIGRPTYVRNSVAAQLAYWDGRRDEVVESMKADVVEFYEKMELCDIITFKEAGLVPAKGEKGEMPKRIADDVYEDKQGRVYKLSTISNEFICVKDPIQDSVRYTKERFQESPKESFRAPDPSTMEVYDHLVRHFGKTRYIGGLTAGSGVMVLLGGMERGLMEFAANPELVAAASRHTAERLNLQDPYYLRREIGGAFLEEDFCSTTGPLISPKMFREFCLPSLKSRIENLRRLQPGIQIVFHSCGNSRRIIDQFIEAGVQVYQSLQSIPEMWVGDLKKEYGDKLVFWGGVPVEELVAGTAEDIRKSVRKAMEATRGGGFILGPSHSIAYGTKYENFMAMLDEFDKLRFRCREL